jgi:hypothetical protein
VPIPSYATDASVAAYMHATLGPVADLLGYAVAYSYEEAIAGTLLMLGWEAVTEADTATKTARLRAVARWQAWQMVADQTAGYTEFSSDGQHHYAQQLHAQAKAMALAAEMDAQRLGVGGAMVSRTKLRYPQDPYDSSFAESERTL